MAAPPKRGRHRNGSTGWTINSKRHDLKTGLGVAAGAMGALPCFRPERVLPPFSGRDGAALTVIGAGAAGMAGAGTGVAAVVTTGAFMMDGED